MANVVGIDLGTNSIGWAIRDTMVQGNQIIDFGVLTFEKGVADGKSGEFPMVKKRTESRGKRRNYQAEKYRKWELLKCLIDEGMVPLSISELDRWRKYEKGVGRVYPQSQAFLNWLRFDFDGDGKPDFEKLGFSKHESHYLFRMLAISQQPEHQRIFVDNPQILGRVLYHLVQRRGFRGRDEEEARTINEGNNETQGANDVKENIKRYHTLGAALYHMHRDEGVRIRKRYNLRSDFESELKEISRVNNIGREAYKKLYKAIIWQRPLRGQKGLVGYCTFEPPVKNDEGGYIKSGKKRCPTSHPLYEEYRTWVFINNLKIELPDNVDKVQYIQGTIYPLFYNKSRDFKLSSISRELKKVGGQIRAKFDSETKVISCVLLNAFETILGEGWENRYDWENILSGRPKKTAYSIEDIWHVLFTFDSDEKLKEFAINKLGILSEKAEEFSKIKLQQGYATLSLSAIKKLLPFLRRGFIYPEAVFLANMHRVLGKADLSDMDIAVFSDIFREESEKQKKATLTGNIINSLISEQLNSDHRYGMEKNYQLDGIDHKDILKKIEELDGAYSWAKRSIEEKNTLVSEISERYLTFLRQPITAVKERLFVKVPRLHDRIFERLQKDYGVPENKKNELWHPSEQDTYEKAKEINSIKLLGDPRPISNGFKNPMALKTLYKLKSLINYLITNNKIDEDTRVVVEIARELNDANKRKAIQRWQQDREKENLEFKERIHKDCGIQIEEITERDIDKYRLWDEQERKCLYTGKPINIKSLFSADYDFEHTISAVLSFDDELKNLTVADTKYNREVKKKQLPTQIGNYEKDFLYDGIEYTPIKPRLKFMFEKVETLENQYIEWKNKTKFASTKDIKDACIQRRHYIKMDLDYWRHKLNTFTWTEYKIGWRNSQLRDTQTVTKYALPYLKTVFKKVTVEKGAVTDKFKEIYSIKLSANKKDRSLHSHHAIDAAILTLIPPSALRDKILERYEREKDKEFGSVYHEGVYQWNGFKADYLISISNNILINFQPQYRTLCPTIKNVRKRGKQQYLRDRDKEGKWQYRLDSDGNKIPLIAKGDSIRGQLHKETFFGAVKIPEYEFERGKYIPKTDGMGNFVFQKNEKRNDELFFVTKVLLTSFSKPEDFDIVVDPNLRKFLKEETSRRIAMGLTFVASINNLYAFNKESDKEGNKLRPIRHVRCKVKGGGGGFITNPAVIKENFSYPPSKKEYKQQLYAQNGETILAALYQDLIEGNLVRIMKPYSILQIAASKADRFDAAVPQLLEYTRKNKIKMIPLYAILKIKQKVIFYEKDMDEVKSLSVIELSKRLYLVTTFEEGQISFKHHINARSEDEIAKQMQSMELPSSGASSFDFHKPIPRLRLSKASFDFAIEGKHFDINLDGSVQWKF